MAMAQYFWSIVCLRTYLRLLHWLPLGFRLLFGWGARGHCSSTARGASLWSHSCAVQLYLPEQMETICLGVVGRGYFFGHLNLAPLVPVVACMVMLETKFSLAIMLSCDWCFLQYSASIHRSISFTPDWFLFLFFVFLFLLFLLCLMCHGDDTILYGLESCHLLCHLHWGDYHIDNIGDPKT